jgi:lysozyme family protein
MKHFLFLPFFILLVSCAAMDPANVDVELPEAAPQVKVTNYSKALQDLGLMSQIYAVSPVKIQSNPIGDNTGTSGSTGGEIPRDITEMIKSSLNSIGGQITFIPYDPAFIQNQIVTGYSTFDNKLIPDVVISGGITEFDRGLETRGTNTDAGVEATFTNAPKWTPSDTVSIDYSDSDKVGLARITLDFNLLNFVTMAGISRMNTVNSMEVRKGLAEKELGIALFGPTFGRKGSIKKVQGRHAAVRLLVEVSMMQIVGKYLNLPYWRLLGEDALPDEVVMSALSQDFYSTSENIRIAKAQEWLFLLGYDVQVNGILDEKTVAALTAFDPTVSAQEPSLSYETYAALFQAVPIQPETLGRRQLLAQAPAQVQPARTQKRAAVSQPAATQAAAAPAPAPEQPAPRTSQTQTSTSSQPAPAASSSSSGGIGRKLSEEDW